MSITAAIAAGLAFTCTPVAVWDGDGPVHCAEGPRLRIGGISARELDGTCRPHHPCPRASAQAARDALVRLLGGPRGRGPHGHVLVAAPPMQCSSNGATHQRTAAFCTLADGRDLGCAMLASGTVKKWSAFWGDRRCH